jgi:hypothetical protein
MNNNKRTPTTDALIWGEIGHQAVSDSPPEDWLPLLEDLIHRCEREQPPITVPFTAPELVEAVEKWRYVVLRIPISQQ